ncbi:MAG: hypothetical protein NVSMB9_04890 [Isosphaeraceae bacterium]
MHKVVGMFDSRVEAEAVVQRLKNVGVGPDSISVAIKHTHSSQGASLSEATGVKDLTEEGTAAGAVSGAAVGTLVGLLVAGSTFLLPGIGTFLVAGPLAAALTGAGVGAASGGVL